MQHIFYYIGFLSIINVVISFYNIKTALSDANKLKKMILNVYEINQNSLQQIVGNEINEINKEKKYFTTIFVLIISLWKVTGLLFNFTLFSILIGISLSPLLTIFIKKEVHIRQIIIIAFSSEILFTFYILYCHFTAVPFNF